MEETKAVKTNDRARILKMKMYLQLTNKKLVAFNQYSCRVGIDIPLAVDYSDKFRSNVVDLIERHGRVLQTKRIPIDVWIEMMPFLTPESVKKMICTSAMALFLVMENSAVLHPEQHTPQGVTLGRRRSIETSLPGMLPMSPFQVARELAKHYDKNGS